ncbi:hypothetical protein VH22019_00004 [Vibrio phage VH2_2019]|nr:hypothetical protein VH22019_00004 [Vibrio phage VH2_2019]
MAIVIKTKKTKAVPTVTANSGVTAKLEVSEVDTATGDETLVAEQEIPVTLPEQEFTQPTANVGYSAGVTRNLGDFNSMKIQVSLHLPCYVNEVHPTFDFAREFVDDKLNDILAEYDEE